MAISLLAACLLTSVAAADVIKIGLVTPLSQPGDYKSGQVNVQAVELAVAELNEKGGVLGKKVELVKADDEGKPAVGVTSLKRMLSDGDVSATVGHWHSSVSVAQARVSNKMGVPMLLHYSWDDALTAGHSDYVWRVGPFNSEIAGLMTPFLVKQGFKTAAVMYETTAFGTGFGEALKKNAESNGIKVYDIGYPAEATDLRPQLLELKGKSPQPEVLIIAAVYQAMYLIPKQAHEIGLAPACKMMTSWDWTVYPDFWEVNGDDGVGTLVPDFTSSKLALSPLGKHFKKTFTAKYGFEPPIYTYFLYDEVMIVADAIERAKSADPKKIMEALKTTKFAGTTGEITFDRKDGPVWNQWMGHQLFVKKITAAKQSSADYEVIYP
ncbi:MAG: ABC transporter substrate-binding protein [Desulfobacterales bacterium]|nr:ABC transporter substrate-binding protein [Desulfobacterales bacterium]